MGSLFKRRRNNKESVNWHCEFRDAVGILRRLPLLKDKRTSEQMLGNVERLRDFRQARRALDAFLLDFVEGLPGAVRARLAEWGLLDRAQAGAGEPLAVHLSVWLDFMRAASRKPSHIKFSAARIRQLCDGCGFHHLTDIRPDAVNSFLLQLKDRGLGARARNSYLVAMRTFITYLVKTGVLSENPLRVIEKSNENTDRRWIRRLPTEDEFSRLLAYCEGAPVHCGLDGHSRRIAYELAALFGLRFSEVQTLQRKDLSLDGGSPTITIRATNSKNKKAATLPFPPQLGYLVEMLQDYLSARLDLPNAPVFKGLWLDCGAKMIKADLIGAGVAVETAEGSICFHTLRAYAATRLAAAGVPPAVCKEILRHADIQTTMKYYTRISLTNKAEGLAMLKRITPAVHALKTGTDDADIVDKKTDSNRGQNGVFLSQEVTICDSGLSCNTAGKTKTASLDFSRTCGSVYSGTRCRT